MNKKAYIQTLEAVVAIMIIYLFIGSIILKNKPQEAQVPLDIRLTQSSILNEIESSDFYRDCVLYNNISCVFHLVNTSVSSKYGFNFSLCTFDSCELPKNMPIKEVYLKSYILSSNLTKFETTSVNLFLWRKI